MVSRILLFLAVLLLPAQAFAQAAPQEPVGSLEGHWALRIDNATIFVFRLDERADGTWQGAWKRPARISSNGAVFQAMDGVDIAFATAAVERGDEVQLTFAGPAGDGRTDVLRFRWTSMNQALLTYVGIPGDPYPLIRVAPDTDLGPFDSGRIYDRDRAVVEAPFDEAREPQGLVDVAEAENAGEASTDEVEVGETLAAALDLPPLEPLAERDEVAEEAAADEPEELQAETEPVAAPVAAEPAVVAEADAGFTVEWEPLGLVDARREAAARAAAGEAVATGPEQAEEAEADDAPEAAERELPRIDADFLDGL